MISCAIESTHDVNITSVDKSLAIIFSFHLAQYMHDIFHAFLIYRFFVISFVKVGSSNVFLESS